MTRRDRVWLTPGGEVQVETTIGHESRQSGEAVVIDSFTDDVALPLE